MSKFGAHHVLDIGDGSADGRHRSLTTPRSNRRVIFPSLHDIIIASPPSYPLEPKSRHERGKSLGDLSPSPTTVDTNIQLASLNTPLLHRANSLDGILIPLPKLSLKEDPKSPEECTPPRSLYQRPKPQDPTHQASIPPAPPSKWSPHRSSSAERQSKSLIFGGAVRHRTYYPAASIPTPVNHKKSPSHTLPCSSILRRKTPPFSPCDNSNSLSESGSNLVSSPVPQSSQAVTPPCLSPAVPTLASPASIKSLHPSRIDGEEQDNIGESEDDLERMSDFPKILPRPRQQLKVRRISSDTVVSKNEEEHSVGSVHESVSRHASLECLSNNKRISFDAHIKVYEFGITDYERKGGEKWWGEDELSQFKQEAIQRIRSRSMKVIPTGTGRALAVGPKQEQVNQRGRASSVGSKTGRKSNPSSISFNHPALGCDDECDPESRCDRNTSINDALSQEIRNILVVDPHEIFLALFTKSLNHMIPHASVATARSAEEAMTRIEAARNAFPLSDGGSTHGFDIIIIEERLRSSFSDQPLASDPRTSLTQHGVSSQSAGDDSIQRRWNMTSGSSMIRYLAESEREINKSDRSGRSTRCSFLVGVSARLPQDQERLEKAGVDCVWGKPPPEMNTRLRDELLKLLMKKRNRLDSKLFD